MSGEGMSADRAPFFDGTGFPRWKVLMQSHLQARGLDVWRVTEEGKKNENKAERQYDAIAKSILLSSLDLDITVRVSFVHTTPTEGRQILDYLLQIFSFPTNLSMTSLSFLRHSSRHLR